MKCEHAPFELVQGLYELKGDTLTLCYIYHPTERPTDMDGKKPRRSVDVQAAQALRPRPLDTDAASVGRKRQRQEPAP
jgi:hypothetical protein